MHRISSLSRIRVLVTCGVQGIRAIVRGHHTWHSWFCFFVQLQGSVCVYAAGVCMHGRIARPLLTTSQPLQIASTKRDACAANLQAVGAPAALVRGAGDVILQLWRQGRQVQEEVLCPVRRPHKNDLTSINIVETWMMLLQSWLTVSLRCVGQHAVR